MAAGIVAERVFFFFNETATTEIYTSIDTLSLHDALPISNDVIWCQVLGTTVNLQVNGTRSEEHTSELQSPIDISYAVFCLKKKTKDNRHHYSLRNHHVITLFLVAPAECRLSAAQAIRRF